MHCVQVSWVVCRRGDCDGRTDLKVITGGEVVVDTACLGTAWAKSNSLRPLLLVCQPPPGDTGGSDTGVDVNEGLEETTGTGGLNGDGLGATTGAEAQNIEDQRVSETVIFALSETGRNGEGVGKLGDRVGNCVVADNSTTKVFVRGVDVETLAKKTRSAHCPIVRYTD